MIFPDISKTDICQKFRLAPFPSYPFKLLSIVFVMQVHRIPNADGSPGRNQKVHLQLWDTAGQEREMCQSHASNVD